MTAREEILTRIRTALADRPDGGAAPEIRRDYRAAGTPTDVDLVALAVERISDYQATVHRTDEAGAAGVIARALAERGAQTPTERGAQRIVVPAGFPAELLAAASITELADDPQLSATELDGVDGVVTTCAVAVAETGTIVLDAAPGQGRRALTLVPDYHLVVVRADQVVASVPDAVARLDGTRPLTWISGPSATSDIELSRVEGVHGPRTLVVVMIA